MHRYLIALVTEHLKIGGKVFFLTKELPEKEALRRIKIQMERIKNRIK